MHIIMHRRNAIEELRATSPEYGVEVDIRSKGDELIIHHDPFQEGDRFADWIECYRHGVLILNVKEEGLEQRLLAEMAAHGVKDFFFLDQSFPFLLKTARTGERRCAVRFSEYESIDTVLSVAPLIDWLWIDCFSRLPLTRETVAAIKQSGLRTCLVSPELQGRWEEEEVARMRLQMADLAFLPTAVCTKKPALWT